MNRVLRKRLGRELNTLSSTEQPNMVSKTRLRTDSSAFLFLLQTSRKRK